LPGRTGAPCQPKHVWVDFTGSPYMQEMRVSFFLFEAPSLPWCSSPAGLTRFRPRDLSLFPVPPLVLKLVNLLRHPCKTNACPFPDSRQTSLPDPFANGFSALRTHHGFFGEDGRFPITFSPPPPPPFFTRSYFCSLDTWIPASR